MFRVNRDVQIISLISKERRDISSSTRNIVIRVLQTLFNLYSYNQKTNSHKPSYTRRPQIRAIYTYVRCTKAITNNQDIRPLVTVKVLLAINSGMTTWILMIKVALESTHQTVSNDISYIIWRSIFIEIQAYQCSNIISYFLKLA